MYKNSFEERRRGLEEAFFAKQNNSLLEKIRKDKEKEQNKIELKNLTGFKNDELIEKIASSNVTTASFAALSLFPLVKLAWVDKYVSAEEKEAVLNAAKREGIDESSPSYTLLESWLQKEPCNDLFEAWKAYIEALKTELSYRDYLDVSNEITALLEDVASHTRKILGLSFIAHHENQTLKEIKTVLIS